jgi:hypothetical protein
LRGDTDFTQTERLDDGLPGREVCLRHRRHEESVRFGGELPPNAWKTLVRRANRKVKTRPRQRPPNVKQEVIEAPRVQGHRLVKEACGRVSLSAGEVQESLSRGVVWKDLDVYQGQKKLFDDARCFFYITNDEAKSAEAIVFDANQRCNQENLLAQLKGGVRSLVAPSMACSRIGRTWRWRRWPGA